MTRRFVRSVVLSAAGLVAAGLIAGAAGPSRPAVLDRISPGHWELRGADGAAGRSLCVTDPAQLLQLAHAGARCTRTVIDAAPDTLTVQYSCPGLGQGRTTLSARDGTSVRVQTQGLARGAPFDLDYDGKRIGACRPN